MSAPIFVHVGGRIINVEQIKWVGVKDERVYVEFIAGGWTVLDPEITREEFRRALHEAIKASEPF